MWFSKKKGVPVSWVSEEVGSKIRYYRPETGLIIATVYKCDDGYTASVRGASFNAIYRSRKETQIVVERYLLTFFRNLDK